MNKGSIQKASVAAAISISLIAAIAYFAPRTQTVQRTVTGVQPDDRPPDVQQGEDVRPGLRPSGVAVSERSTIQRTNPETGELEQEFFYEQLSPREEGVFDMTNPHARLYLSPTRVIELRSQAGRFVAPDNHPQSGQFSDEVVITLYQSEAGQVLDLSRDSPHRMLQIELDEAEFDTVLGEIRSGSDVRVTTPATDQVEFAGRGLTLLYNELERRIEYMQITHGQSLRYRAAEADEEEADDQPDEVADADADAADDEAPAEPQLYQLTFEQDVVAQSAENRIEADRLVAFFSLNRAGGEVAERPRRGGPEANELAAPLPGRERGHPPHPTSPPRGRGVADAVPPAASDRLVEGAWVQASGELVPEAPEPVTTEQLRETGDADDLVMTWTGSMVMIPAEHTPPQMESADDVYVQFEGSPVQVALAGGEQMTARALRYSELSGQVEAIGNASHPMRITSPAVGRATASRLVMNLDAGHAQLAGAGSIRTDTLGDDADDAAEAASGLPPGFAASWSRQVDVYFAAGDGDAEGPGEIESARFAGDVHVRDDQFELYSETLTTQFAAAAEGEDPQLEQVEAEGDVAVSLGEEGGSIAAQWLRIETEPDEAGQLQPRRLLAEGDVEIVDQQQQIQADQLAVMLEPAEAADGETGLALSGAGEDQDDDDASRRGRISGVAVRHIEARQNVRLLLGDGMVARGDYITADARTSEAHLRGEPVVLSRYTPGEEEDVDAEPLTELRVAELFLEDEGRLAYADGPGTFTYIEPAEQQDQPDQRVRVNWSQRMQYDDATQTIEVHGEVVAEAEDDPAELNRLTSRMLALELVDPAVLAEAKGEPVDDEAIAEAEEDDAAADDEAEGIDEMMGGRRQLHRLTARGDAVLTGTRWSNERRNRVLTRFRVAGPQLAFNNVQSVARVEGEGSLLIEDYRPTSDAETETEAEPSSADEPATDEVAEAEDAADATPATPMSGRGATLFTWTDELEIDEAESDMRMAGGVKMTHRPMGSSDVIELETDTLVADMRSMQGVEAMGMTEVDSMEVNHIAATGNVQVRDAERMITAGQLFYDGPANTILLQRGEQRNVQVIRVDEPRPLRASEILWNLDTDTLEILDAGF